MAHAKDHPSHRVHANPLTMRSISIDDDRTDTIILALEEEEEEYLQRAFSFCLNEACPDSMNEQESEKLLRKNLQDERISLPQTPSSRSPE